MRALASAILTLLFSFSAVAQMVEVKDEAAPAEADSSGKAKAEGYFKDRKASKVAPVRRGAEDASSGPPRFLALHVGTFFSDEAYKWGRGDQNNIGRLNAGVDYRLGEWVNAADLSLRLDFTSYSLDEGTARKLSVGAIVTFPDANSRFPLYFGIGMGPGFFIKQIHNESAVAFDYSLLAGARFLEVIEQIGFMVEVGLKDHLHLFSDGQYNGIYINVGSVFAF